MDVLVFRYRRVLENFPVLVERGAGYLKTPQKMTIERGRFAKPIGLAECY